MVGPRGEACLGDLGLSCQERRAPESRLMGCWKVVSWEKTLLVISPPAIAIRATMVERLPI
jgi:hypothetical protein